MYSNASEGYSGYTKGFLFRPIMFGFLSMLLILGFLICSADKTYAAQGDFEWAKRAGGSDENDRGLGIALDGSGNSYVTGFFGETAVFGSNTLSSVGHYDIFVAKYDNTGGAVWAKRAGGTGGDQGHGIAADSSGNSYVTGYFSTSATFGKGEVNEITLSGSGTEIFVAKYNSDGTLAWAKRAGGATGDFGNGIVVDSAGNSYVTGSCQSTANFDAISLTSSGASDIFVAKYNSSGNVVWAKAAGSSGNDEGKAVIIDASGNSYITGNFSLTANFGATSITSAGNEDIFAAKYDSAGNVLWAKNVGSGTLSSAGRGIAVDSSGNTYLTGTTRGTVTFGTTTLVTSGIYDIFVAKCDSSGNVLWADGVGGVAYDHGYGITVDDWGNSYVTGGFYGTATFGTFTLTSVGYPDIFITKYDTDGNVLWVEGVGSPSDDYGEGIALDSFGNVYTTGFFGYNSDSANFGSITLTSEGFNDIFVAKYSEGAGCGTICNPSFEDGLSFWKTSGTPNNQVSTDAIDGLNSLYSEHTRTVNMSPSWSGVNQALNSIKPAETYGLSIWVKSLNVARGHVKIKWYNSAGTVSQVDYPITNINGTINDWTNMSKLVTSPSDAARAEIYIWHGINTSSQNVPGSTLWVDNIEFSIATSACGTLCNESFEHGTLYWTISGKTGSHTIDTSSFHEGLKSLKSEQLYGSTDPAKWAGVTQFAQVKEGVTYRLRLWLQTDSVSNGHVRIRWRDTGGSLLNTQYPITGISGTNGTWFNQQSTITAPSGANKAEITIFHGVNAGTNIFGSTMWVDDITLICESLCNGGFEDGYIHWETKAPNKGEIITTDVQEGTRAMKSVQSLSASDNVQWTGISQRLMVSGGSSYDLSFWLKKENASQGHVKIKWWDASDQLISQQFPIGGMNGTNLTWTEMSTTLTAPANAESMELFIWHGVDGANQNVLGSTLYLDNVIFAQI